MQQGPPADAKLRRELEAELLADAPNDQKIEDLKQQILVPGRGAVTAHHGAEARRAGADAEQRAKARERIAKGRREGRGRGGGRGSSSGVPRF